MSKSYNKSNNKSTNKELLYNNLLKFFLDGFSHSIPLPCLKFTPIMIFAMTDRESIIFSDLADFIAPTLNIHHESAERNISRFLKNPNYDFDYFYNLFIENIFSDFKLKTDLNKVQIAFDHMFIEHRYTILMFSLRIGKQSIPIYFKSYEWGDVEAFKYETFIEGIDFCHNLIKKYYPNAKINFLADRFWGNHIDLFNYINDLNDFFNIRAKGDMLTLIFDAKEGHEIFKPIKDLDSYVYHSKAYENIKLTRNKECICNLVISKSDGHKEPFYILTNGDTNFAVKDYSKRFGAIEFLFKAQKTNGFFLEETQLKDIYSFNSLYTIICMAETLCTILGIDYSKNKRCHKDINIRATKMVNGKRIRIISFFRVGLKMIKFALESKKTTNLFKRIILYDV